MKMKKHSHLRITEFFWVLAALLYQLHGQWIGRYCELFTFNQLQNPQPVVVLLDTATIKHFCKLIAKRYCVLNNTDPNNKTDAVPV